MAHKLLKICVTSLQTPFISRVLNSGTSCGTLQCRPGYLQFLNPPVQFRNATFFNRYPADRLWKSATNVSNAGRKRGRAKSRRMIKNLNRGQVIGVGKVNMVWPGLNAPAVRGRELVQQQQLPEDPEREKQIFKLRDSMQRRRKVKLHPLERGWSGGKPGGRRIGPPDPIGEEKFEGFDSVILEYKLVTVMTGNMGRKRRVSCMVLTGNKNGLAGFSVAKAPEGKAALRIAKNRAAMKLMLINRCNEHTVYHDFFCQFGKTKIYVTKKSEGYGLRCHRAIKSCCELIGIKDLHAKVEGSHNLQHIIKAFFIGLLQQKTHEQLAEEKKLHLVEFRNENDIFPTVVASPTQVRKPEEIKPDEIMDFTQRRKTAWLRNKDEVRIRMYAEHGELRSFYTDKYPEAKPSLWNKNLKAKEEAEFE